MPIFKLEEPQTEMSLEKAKEILSKCDWKLTKKEKEAKKAILNEFNKLIEIATETAFDRFNERTETLLRRLKALGKIKLVNGEYQRDKLDFEEHFIIDGIEYNKEKMFILEEDKIDEYTKQCEYKIELYDNMIDKMIADIITEEYPDNIIADSHHVRKYYEGLAKEEKE